MTKLLPLAVIVVVCASACATRYKPLSTHVWAAPEGFTSCPDNYLVGFGAPTCETGWCCAPTGGGQIRCIDWLGEVEAPRQ